jgi:putative membrane protein
MYYYYWGMNAFWWIFWILLVAVLVFFTWPTESRRRDSALESLRRLYASGEISEDEYRHRLAVLGEPKTSRPPPPARSIDARDQHSPAS